MLNRSASLILFSGHPVDMPLDCVPTSDAHPRFDELQEAGFNAESTLDGSIEAVDDGYLTSNLRTYEE